ncbi:PQQ-binding-like beta-propeller repeat protein [Nocardioides sp. R1-1]|uniref:outer membrane protein assembly factor BamB family protein n=1 Tax=Nocardioides sp. R1-1 TaxID=3383502 RepID=UPI0038D234D9
MSTAPTARRLAAAAALVTGLGLAACDAGAERPGRPGEPDRPAAAVVLGEPGRDWEVRAADIVPNGRFVPLAPVGDDEAGDPAGVVVGDVLVAAVADEGAEDAAPLLVGITGDGEVRWRGRGYGACWSPDDVALYCTRGTALVRVDPETGGAGARADVTPAPGDAPVLDDGVLYVVVTPPGADEDAYPPPFAVAALDAETLERRWSADAGGLAELRGLGAGSPALDLTGPNVSVAAWRETRFGQADASQLELDRETGSVLSTTHLGKGAFLERPWTVRRGFGNDRLAVSRDGQPLLELSGQPWDSRDGRLTTPEGLVGVGPALYDATTGEAVWERPDLGDELSGWRWTADRAQVAVTGFDPKAGEMTTTYLDARTGETQWTGAGSDVAPAETPDAFVQVRTDHSSSWVVEALDRDTGEVAWSRDVTPVGRAGNEDGLAIGGPYVSTGTVWALGATTLVGFTDFPD